MAHPRQTRPGDALLSDWLAEPRDWRADPYDVCNVFRVLVQNAHARTAWCLSYPASLVTMLATGVGLCCLFTLKQWLQRNR